MNKIKDLTMETPNSYLVTPKARKKLTWWHCVIIYLVANIIGIAAAGFNGDEAFYNAFTQPGVAPPDWLFAPMWFFLNVTSLVGLYTITNLSRDTKNRGTIIVLEYIAWSLYAIFPFMYFYLQSPIMGAANTLMGLIIIIGVVIMSYPISKKSFWCFVPRLLWLLLASYVSTWIALHNQDAFFDIGPFIR